MRVSTGCDPVPSSSAGIGHTYFWRLLALVLALAAFNLGFRLDREVVTEWDEALYATSAAETATYGNWIGTTFHRELDYYNTKPPLNVWLIAASFKLFGTSLFSLRLPSAIAAWLTVLVLMLWARRAFGPAAAILAGVVLSTTFGFLYVHSGRSANTDAVFTLLMLLVAVTLWTSAGAAVAPGLARTAGRVDLPAARHGGADAADTGRRRAGARLAAAARAMGAAAGRGRADGGAGRRAGSRPAGRSIRCASSSAWSPTTSWHAARARSRATPARRSTT